MTADREQIMAARRPFRLVDFLLLLLVLAVAAAVAARRRYVVTQRSARRWARVHPATSPRRSVADMRLRIIGDGPLRPELESWVTAHGAGSWVELPGRIDRVALRDEYRRAWVVASASLAEGWGLTLTEAAACGTPAVATAIRGHRCSVVDGVTGVLAPPAELGRALAGVLTDHERRDRLGAAALARARSLTWDASALGVLRVFHRVVAARGRAAGAEVGLTGRTGRASAG